MKIIVFGARGDVGSRVAAEALSRGHDVVAAVRTEAQRFQAPRGARSVVVDVTNRDAAAAAMASADVAISAVRPPDGREADLAPLTRAALDAAAAARTRLIVVGGAASLRLSEDATDTVLTAPGFLPEGIRPIAEACQTQFELCMAETAADWTYLCPPAILTPGERTGRYRIGDDALVVDERGVSAISMEDFAVALIDEAERPSHRQSRFTVAA